MALRAAEQATALRWGVRLGHAYAVYRDGRREADELKVDFLRPAADELGQFLCLGSSLGVTYLFVLGKDAVRFEATGPGNIVSLMPFSRARQGR